MTSILEKLHQMIDKVNNKYNNLIGLFFVFAGSIITALLAFSRNFFNFGVETDFLSSFVPDAVHFLNLEPLRLKFHPPFYSIGLAGTYMIFSDWYSTGIFLSWFSSTLVLICTYLIFSLFDDKYMVNMALVSLITSQTFLVFSAEATSDMFFVAMYMLSLLLAFVAFKKNNKFWGLAGVLLGLTILTRANGFVLIFVIGLPWFQKNPLNKRTKSFLVLIGSIIIVLLLWVLLASYLESPLWPTKSYTSIAQTYYSPTEDRRSEEGRIFAEQQVANMIQIFTNNPVHVIKIYIEGMRNFYSLLLRTNNLVVFPLGILAILGALLYFGSKRNRLFLFLVLITIVHTIFINFRPYEGRYFLYLIPVIGACAGFAIETIVANIQKRVMIILASLFLIIFMISGFIKSLQYSIDVHHANDIELGDIIPNIQTLVDNDCTIIARKPHIPYYGNCNYLYFPNVEDFESLKKEISHREINHSTYLYYGSAENHFRPQFNQLMNPETSPAWLIPVSQSELPSSWVLYEVKKSP